MKEQQHTKKTTPPEQNLQLTTRSTQRPPQGPVFWSVLIRRLIKNNVLHNNPQKVPGFIEECLSLGRTRLCLLIVFKKVFHPASSRL